MRGQLGLEIESSFCAEYYAQYPLHLITWPAYVRLTISGRCADARATGVTMLTLRSRTPGASHTHFGHGVADSAGT